MQFIIAAILIILWCIALLASYTLGGMIHLLLIIAALVVLLRYLREGEFSGTRA